ncbi:fasciclin domain-containing protein [Chitinophaga sp.]|uniref:fasciclin domain-containing protein n=1 Tax=Chitinophaga sp. TaxID=1869181 RepID=UPI002F925548
MKVCIKIFAAYALCLQLLSACTKTEEPPKRVGEELPYTGGATRSLAQLLDSIPEASIYRAAFSRTTVQQYMDSLSEGVIKSPYTLFVPTDKAWQAAGYTKENINTVPVAELDTIIRYLAVAGGMPANNSVFGGVTFYPLMYSDGSLTRTMVPGPFNPALAYFYRLSAGIYNGALQLNGKQVSKTPAIAATNGTIFMIDSLVIKPFYESYQVLAADTSFSFYMAAMRKNNALYEEKGIIGTSYTFIQFNDTVPLVLTSGLTSPGTDPIAIVFAPDNNAFRKAGFNSIADINSYIDRSALASSPDGTQMLTNMDSILVNHRLLSNFTNNSNTRLNPNYTYLYTGGLANGYYPGKLDNRNALGAIFITRNNGQIILHRQDAPSGRGAVITGPSDITTLTGVIHRVDNLLLPTP